MKTAVAGGLCALIGLALIHAISGPVILPEMAECLQLHGAEEKYSEALKRYCDPGIAGDAMELAAVDNPQVIGVKHSGKAVCYLVEGSKTEVSAQAPASSTCEYSVCWDNGRIVSIEFMGRRPGI